MAEKRFSIIHPNLFNTALDKCGVKGLKVYDDPEGDTGLKVEIEDDAQLAGQLANLALAHHTTVGMVLDSNVGRLKQLMQDMRALNPRADDRDMYEDMIDSLESVLDNLGSTVSDYREKGAVDSGG